MKFNISLTNEDTSNKKCIYFLFNEMVMMSMIDIYNFNIRLPSGKNQSALETIISNRLLTDPLLAILAL